MRRRPEQLAHHARRAAGGAIAALQQERAHHAVPGIKVTAVRAEHSSIYVWRNPASGKTRRIPAASLWLYHRAGERLQVWHMGDTGVFAT